MSEKTYVGVRKKGATWSYRFTIVVGGRTISKEQSGFPSAYSAHKAREEEIARCKIDNGADKNITLDKVQEKFIATEGSITRAYGTILKYQSMYKNHIGPRFGKSKIGKIRAVALQEFVAEMANKWHSFYEKEIAGYSVVFEICRNMGFSVFSDFKVSDKGVLYGSDKVEQANDALKELVLGGITQIIGHLLLYIYSEIITKKSVRV